MKKQILFVFKLWTDGIVEVMQNFSEKEKIFFSEYFLLQNGFNRYN